jgi:protein involved in polysaccharide export with SLBB domain
VKPQTLSNVIAIIIVVLTVIAFTQLTPGLSYLQQPISLLNETAILTENNPQTQYNLTLNQGDQLKIQVQGNGELVDLTIAQQSSPSQTLVDQSALLPEYSLEWTVPQNGVYIFTLVAESTAEAAITVTKA